MLRLLDRSGCAQYTKRRHQFYPRTSATLHEQHPATPRQEGDAHMCPYLVLLPAVLTGSVAMPSAVPVTHDGSISCQKRHHFMPGEYLRSTSSSGCLATGLHYQLLEVTSVPKYHGRRGRTVTSIKFHCPSEVCYH